MGHAVIKTALLLLYSVCVYNHNPSSKQKGSGMNFWPWINTLSLCTLLILVTIFLTHFNGYDKFLYCDLTSHSLLSLYHHLLLTFNWLLNFTNSMVNLPNLLVGFSNYFTHLCSPSLMIQHHVTNFFYLWTHSLKPVTSQFFSTSATYKHLPRRCHNLLLINPSKLELLVGPL